MNCLGHLASRYERPNSRVPAQGTFTPSLVLGWALVTGNPWNYAYATLVPVIFHLRVVLYEEREMQRLFGREWHAYRSAVPRWGLRFRPYIPSVEPGAARNDGPAAPLGNSRVTEELPSVNR